MKISIFKWIKTLFTKIYVSSIEKRHKKLSDSGVFICDEEPLLSKLLRGDKNEKI
jgi:hypothetical protein